MKISTLALYPFSVLYDGVTQFRNFMYDTGRKTSFEFDVNVISVGNLSVGGTGKTPMVEYIIRLLAPETSIATLSRGYGRKTKGFRIANNDDSPKTIGDEPYQIHQKFPEIPVTVGEERAVAIPFILAEHPQLSTIILDDAYQHRPVKPNLNILLTDYSRPFFNDYVLPAGRLRENRNGAARADIIVITKCPSASIDYQYYIDNIRKYNSEAIIAFTAIGYEKPTGINTDANMKPDVFLVTGIANPASLVEQVKKGYNLVGQYQFKDHHDYSLKDIELIKERFSVAEGNDKCIITTEKDMVKLKPLIDESGIDIPFFYIPIKTLFLKGEEEFNSAILGTLQ